MIYRKQINNISANSIVSFLLILGILWGLLPWEIFGQTKETSGLSTVIIDAGHGGKDPGAVVGKAVEKDIVLDIALRLGNLIKKNLPGVKIIYTRKGDYFVPLFKRSVIANTSNANLFISIHANFCSSSSIKGTETYVLGLHRTQDNLEVAKKENSVILLEEDYSRRYEGFDPNSTESYIAFELIQDNYIEQSVLFAGMVQDVLHQHAGRSDRDVRQAGFLVLRETAMPSVLIETGYLSNKAEAAYLMTPEGREAIATSIFNSVKNYKTKFESRLNYASVENVSRSDSDKNLMNSVPKQSAKKKESVSRIQNSTQKQPKDIVASSPVNTKKEQVKSKEKTVSSDKVAGSGKNRSKTENQESSSDDKDKKPDQQTREDNTLASASDLTKEASPDQFSYAIQIVASKVKLSKSFHLFKGIDNIREIQILGYYKYYCSESVSKTQVLKDFRLIRQKIPDAFIVVMKNGVPVPR